MRMGILFFVLLCCCIILIISFNQLATTPILNSLHNTQSKKSPALEIETINTIPLPEGFTRIEVTKDSFGEWIGNIKLKKDNTVYLYNGKPKPDQHSHYAVLDISTGNKDLQQCADAIMRLRAEYYFSRKEYDKIRFRSNLVFYNFKDFSQQGKPCYSHDCLVTFLEKVFTYCGTYTVDEMTRPIKMNEMQAGDIFVKAGSPGHAMIVVDVAVNKSTGKKIYLLAQGYMPAQDMHIVINPNSLTLSPWYEINDDEKIITSGWVFEKNQLKRWK